ncbi:MAG: cupin domain-containing protein [Chitinispirillaceae bacterium]|nr:cupin domain-containing protein [Chitinispirillaceae bacterium]
MPTILKPGQLEFSQGPFNKPPFGLLTVMPNLCNQANAQKLVFDIRKLPPGQYSFPYHYHRNAEEVMLVTGGSMKLRTSRGFEIVNQGETLYFETGESGAHQFFNHTDCPCTYFDVKTFNGMDVVVYPDSGKIMISQYNEVFEHGKQADYFKDEENVAGKWKETGPR